jgi:predicted transcriptional regulator
MEENDETSIANLVKTEDSKEKTKSDSIGIYANTLSVYILTIVSDLEEEIPENNKTITIDTST